LHAPAAWSGLEVSRYHPGIPEASSQDHIARLERGGASLPGEPVFEGAADGFPGSPTAAARHGQAHQVTRHHSPDHVTAM
jgi:hypothetical protein